MSASWNISPLTPALGAEIDGLDVLTLSPAQFAELRALWVQYKVLFIHDQALDTNKLCAFSARFGPLMRLPYIEPVADNPDVIRVLKLAEETNMGVFGGEWHADFSFLDKPPMASILYSIDIPPVGGDTLWANMVLAWQTLSDELKRELSGKRAVHTGAPYGQRHAPPDETRSSGSIRIERNNPAADAETLHPLVVRHPESGESILNVNPTYTTRIDGVGKARSEALLSHLFQHAAKPEFACRFRWRPRTLAIWDNRSTLHYAINDYDGYRRELIRTTVRGERPVSAES